MDISAPVVFTHYTLETFSEKRLQGPEKQRNVGFKLSEPFSFRFQELKTGNARIQYALLGSRLKYGAVALCYCSRTGNLVSWCLNTPPAGGP